MSRLLRRSDRFLCFSLLSDPLPVQVSLLGLNCFQTLGHAMFGNKSIKWERFSRIK